MKGLKWRVTKSPVEYMLVKNWGAVPVPYDWSQLYTGLQSGVVEGQYVASPSKKLGNNIISLICGGNIDSNLFNKIIA